METGERGSNRVSALAEELFASRKADTTDDNSNTSKSVEPAAPPKKKSSFGKNVNFLKLFLYRRNYKNDRNIKEYTGNFIFPI